MKPNERDIQILQHIVRYCNEIASTIDRFGNNKELFIQDFIYRNAISMPFFQISELANHLSQDFLAINKEIPWNYIVGMRNRFAHGYQVMNDLKIWETATVDIPFLKEFCEKAMRDLNDNTGK